MTIKMTRIDPLTGKRVWRKPTQAELETTVTNLQATVLRCEAKVKANPNDKAEQAKLDYWFGMLKDARAEAYPPKRISYGYQGKGDKKFGNTIV